MLTRNSSLSIDVAEAPGVGAPSTLRLARLKASSLLARAGVVALFILAAWVLGWTSALSLVGGGLLIIFGMSWPMLWFATLFTRHRARHGESDGPVVGPAAAPRFTVISPARDEAAVVARMVQQVRAQSYPSWQLLIVANNCTDETAERAREAAEGDPRVEVIEAEFEEGSKADAMNLGLAHSTGNIIVELYADNTVDPSFLESLAEVFADPSVPAVQTAIRAQNAGESVLPLLQDVEFCIYSEVYNRGRRALGLSSSIGGTGFAIRTEVIRGVGGWTNYLVEDFELHLRLTRSRVLVEYFGEAIVRDEKPATWGALIRQRRRWVRGHLSLALKAGSAAGLPWMDRLYLWSPIFVALSFTLLLLGYTSAFLPHAVAPFAYYSPLFWVVSLSLTAVPAWSVMRRGDCALSPPAVLAYVLVFSFHWVVVLGAALLPASWASTKTVHGGVRVRGFASWLGVDGTKSLAVLACTVSLATLWMVPLGQSLAPGGEGRDLLRPIQAPAGSTIHITSAAAATAAELATVTGVVVRESGEPLSGASITLNGQGSQLPSYPLTSDGAGLFWADVVPGTYIVHVSLKGYAPAHDKFTFEAGMAVGLMAILDRTGSSIGFPVVPY